MPCALLFAGKRDLPAPLRNRFTELWIGEPPHRSDLAAIVAGYLTGVAAGAPIDAVVDFYQVLLATGSELKDLSVLAEVHVMLPITAMCDSSEATSAPSCLLHLSQCIVIANGRPL